jgi:hypothetical protein
MSDDKKRRRQEYMRQWREKNADHIKAYWHEWYKANRDEVIARRRKRAMEGDA